jgi:hypothetical protein
MSTDTALPMDLAQQICEQVQRSQPIKLFTQCWGCVTFSKGDPQKMCGGIAKCNKVLARYRDMVARGEIEPE